MYKTSSTIITLDGENLTIEQIISVAKYKAKVKLKKHSIEKIKKCRAWVDKVVNNGTPIVYGLNTGFGSKANVTIPTRSVQDCIPTQERENEFVFVVFC